MHYGHYINNQWQNGQEAVIKAYNPANEEFIGTVTAGTAQDVEKAVEAAAHAFPEWRVLSATQRSILLHGIASKLRQNKEELVHLLTTEEGKPIPESEEEIE